MADVVETYLKQPESYRQLRASVMSRAREFSWQKAITRFTEIWGCGEAN
jgi:hypothetical protein